VAVVEPGPLGGTCLNRGCIPSKMLIHHADVAEAIHNSGTFHIDAVMNGVDFAAITKEVNETVSEEAASIEEGLRKSDNHTLYKEEARFVDEKVIEVGDAKITAEHIVIAAGARPLIPPVDGLEEVDYLTSKEALELDHQPDRLVTIGGGYISMELAHFFQALGTEVVVLEMRDVLLGNEDREIAETYTELAEEKYDVNLGVKATKVDQEGDEITVHAEDKEGNEYSFTGDELLVAAGRRPNTDTLEVENAGIETDDHGFVETDKYLRTNADGVYALGDIAGNWMFRHSANREAEYVIRNLSQEEPEPVDYTAMPHAVFSSPQISGVGKTEDDLEEEGVDYQVGKAEYKNTGKGMALKEEEGFVKVLVDPDGDILGCSIIGPHAASLIHEVLVAMKAGSGTVEDLKETVHIHPALNEVVQRAFYQL
jgi:dihydrolipoamide dehydrogenase